MNPKDMSHLVAETLVQPMSAAPVPVPYPLNTRQKIADELVGGGVNYFEIPVADIVAASAFYEEAFDLDPLGLAEVDGNLFSYFPIAEGASGALAQGESYLPGPQGARVYFKVSDIDRVLSKVEAAGGVINFPKTAVPDFGFVAEFIDIDGNIVALSELPA